MTFEQQMIEAAQQAVINALKDAAIEYKDRIKVPSEFMAQVWGLIDQESLKRKLAARIESELVDRLVNHIAAEMATDIKSILSVQERREALRAIARQHVEGVLKL